MTEQTTLRRPDGQNLSIKSKKHIYVRRFTDVQNRCDLHLKYVIFLFLLKHYLKDSQGMVGRWESNNDIDRGWNIPVDKLKIRFDWRRENW
jgi:hypothetical protein